MIYENIVQPCVIAIQEGNYEFAYMRYKNSVILLEEKFAKPMLQNQLVNTLKRIRQI